MGTGERGPTPAPVFVDGDQDVKVDGSPVAGVKPGALFMVKGDDKEPVIGAASVLAKHYRDESKDSKKRKTWKRRK